MSKKRSRDDNEDLPPPAKATHTMMGGPSTARVNASREALVFEDPFEDEVESESHSDESEDELEYKVDPLDQLDKGMLEDMQVDDYQELPPSLWLPSQRPLADDEELVFDEGAYQLIQRINMEWPCLSFDIIPDNLGAQRTRFPHTMYLAAGTQASQRNKNKIVVMKLSQLCRTRVDDDEYDDGAIVLEDSDDDEGDIDLDPIIEHRDMPHAHGAINRIRVMPNNPNIVATMADTNIVSIYDIKNYLTALDVPSSRKLQAPKPVAQFHGHKDEGYGIAWSKTGKLATADCAGFIHLWQPNVSGFFVDPVPYVGHDDSVEDIQWNPKQEEWFASCSVDGTIRFWDTRAGKSPVSAIQAHNTDVNVISWNSKRTFLMASGADDGEIKVWNLKMMKQEALSARDTIDWHHSPITSIEWSPTDDSTFAASSEDNSVTLWDLSLDKEAYEIDGKMIPGQMLFLHQGQQGIKEIHWHPQIPDVLASTAESGFNVIKPDIRVIRD
eukprot:TRINITY_DN4067_c0_g1_i1.p1 TRINITY_DN4067_c0_g1~~TRINITY_DN4067_c0_g1_i1.p1  ORF type:complete len:507 (+),score=111.10 TRINITY_DN4067_c0_g1_i1:30-1523(+)